MSKRGFRVRAQTAPLRQRPKTIKRPYNPVLPSEKEKGLKTLVEIDSEVDSKVDSKVDSIFYNIPT